LIARGVRCKHKRVWIRSDYDECEMGGLEWRTESPRSLTNQAGVQNIVSVRGYDALHGIAEYLVRGCWQTNDRVASIGGTGGDVFFTVTQAGSSNLQTNSKLEPEAIVFRSRPYHEGMAKLVGTQHQH